MSVWRIKHVDDKARERAAAAADQLGMPLGTWLEQAIMRRVDVAGNADAMAAPPPEGSKESAASVAALASEPKRGKLNRKSRPHEKSSAAPTAALATEGSVAAAADAGLAGMTPVIVAKQETSVATAPHNAAPSSAAMDMLASVDPDIVDAIPAAPANNEVADKEAADNEVVDEITATQAREDAVPGSIIAEPAPQAVQDKRDLIIGRPAPAAFRSERSWLPVWIIAGVALVAAVGGYFLFIEDAGDPTKLAQNPPATGNSATKPVVSAPPPPVAPTPSPAPAAGNAPSVTTPPLPPGVPAAASGVQPSLLIPVPGDGAAPPVATAPPAADFPTRPGPIMAQQDNIPGLIKRGENGDITAQIELGKRYMQGIGTAKDLPQALRWLEKAAEAGNGPAQFNVAVMYETGVGAPADPTKAVAWYRKAAAQLLPVSMALHNLALLYANGAAGLPADPVQARSLMVKAAELDLIQSQYSAALMFYQGIGGPADKAVALSWIAIAARSNDPQLVKAALQLENEVTPAERNQAQQLTKQHDKVIADNKARLRAIASGNAPTSAAIAAPPASSPAAPPEPNKSLDRAAIVELQKLLANLKLYTGPADGTVGSKTEQAIRDYQTMAGLPVDGKATADVLTSLRDVAGAVGKK